MSLEEAAREQCVEQDCDLPGRLPPRTFIEAPVTGHVASSLAWAGMQA